MRIGVVFRRLNPLIVPTFIIAVVAHAVIFAPLPLVVRAAAVLVLTGILPALLLVEWLVGNGSRRADEAERAPLDLWERTLYTIGAVPAVIIITMMLLSYLPGPILRWQTFAAFDGLLLLLLIGVAWWRPAAEPVTLDEWRPVWTSVPRGWLLAGIISLALVGGFLRFSQLNYSEFQGDETRVMLRTAEAIQGLEDTLYIHKKGPGEILLPTVIYSMLDRIDEVSARLPFTLINFVGLFAIFLLGWRMFGPLAGWIAAMILALDGYFIGFARIVQYQSVVYCLVLLTVLILYRLVKVPRKLPQYLILAAIFLATAMLSHYEGVLATLPGIVLFYTMWRRGVSLPRLGLAMVVPLIIGAVMLALFYVPFVLHPSFGATYNYIADSRIGSSFPYNNLDIFFIRTTLYSTTYYFVWMTLVTAAGVAWLYWRNLPRVVAAVATVLIFGGLLWNFFHPVMITIGGTDHTWIFYALALSITWFLPRMAIEERAVWLWFGLTSIFMIFFVRTPNTHVYGFFMPWALIVGYVMAAGYDALARMTSQPVAQWSGVAAATALVAVFGIYAAYYFAFADLEILRNWRTQRPAGYWVSYDMPIGRSIFGFPLTNGWKAAAVLYEDGVIDAPYDLLNKDKEPVAEWYLRGNAKCERDHVYYIWFAAVEPGDRDPDYAIRREVEQKGYQLFGEMTIRGVPHLAIYKLSDEPVTPQIFVGEDYIARYNAELSGPIFERAGATAVPQIQKPADFRFGDSIRLVGYTLEGQDNTPGGAVNLTLYWQADAPVDRAYNVSTQIIDRSDNYKAGQVDGEPVCNTLPTDMWMPGQVIADRYYIPLVEDARAGTYALLISMYTDAGNLEITTVDGISLGDAIGLDEVRIALP